jgi:hypothetical protein
LQKLLFLNFETRLLYGSNKHVQPTNNHGIYPLLTPEHKEALATATANAWKIYREAYDDQAQIRERHDDMSVLNEALPLLPNLEKVNACVFGPKSPAGAALVQQSEYMPRMDLAEFIADDEEGIVSTDTFTALASAVKSCTHLQKFYMLGVNWRSFDPSNVDISCIPQTEVVVP